LAKVSTGATPLGVAAKRICMGDLAALLEDLQVVVDPLMHNVAERR
jgi:hypothetical protein